jgi:hypothetical protein
MRHAVKNNVARARVRKHISDKAKINSRIYYTAGDISYFDKYTSYRKYFIYNINLTLSSNFTNLKKLIIV